MGSENIPKDKLNSIYAAMLIHLRGGIMVKPDGVDELYEDN